MPREKVVFALDAIQDPVSLFEPIYHDGGDAIYVMDQISDSNNQDESWLENISIKEAMKKLNDRGNSRVKIYICFLTKVYINRSKIIYRLKTLKIFSLYLVREKILYC